MLTQRQGLAEFTHAPLPRCNRVWPERLPVPCFLERFVDQLTFYRRERRRAVPRRQRPKMCLALFGCRV